MLLGSAKFVTLTRYTAVGVLSPASSQHCFVLTTSIYSFYATESVDSKWPVDPTMNRFNFSMNKYCLISVDTKGTLYFPFLVVA